MERACTRHVCTRSAGRRRRTGWRGSGAEELSWIVWEKFPVVSVGVLWLEGAEKKWGFWGRVATFFNYKICVSWCIFQFFRACGALCSRAAPSAPQLAPQWPPPTPPTPMAPPGDGYISHGYIFQGSQNDGYIYTHRQKFRVFYQKYPKKNSGAFGAQFFKYYTMFYVWNTLYSFLFC